MSSYGTKEARIERERHTRVNLCGVCGREISDTELLCENCHKGVETSEEGDLPLFVAARMG